MPKGKQWLWVVGVMSGLLVALIVAASFASDPDAEEAKAPRPKATATASASGCDKDDAKDVLDVITPIATEFGDAFDRASATSRIALSEPIGAMQKARREIENADLPECGEPLRRVLREAYQSSIDAFIAFQSQDSAGASASFDKATSLTSAASEMIRELTTDAY